MVKYKMLRRMVPTSYIIIKIKLQNDNTYNK